MNISTLLQPLQIERKNELGLAPDAVIEVQVFQPIATVVVESGAAQYNVGARDVFDTLYHVFDIRSYVKAFRIKFRALINDISSNQPDGDTYDVRIKTR